MGFFADIIRDSHRGERPIPAAGRTSDAAGAAAPAGAVAVMEARMPLEPSAIERSNPSARQLWEEGDGHSVTALHDLAQIEAGTRQVVGLSPSENPRVPALPEAQAVEVVLPQSVKRMQADSESGRTVTDGLRMATTESFHDGGSFDVPVVLASASGSSILRSSSESAMSRTEKVSVETQRRRQAGETRAGLTTPPELLTVPGQIASAEPDAGPAIDGEGRRAPPVAARHPESPEGNCSSGTAAVSAPGRDMAPDDGAVAFQHPIEEDRADTNRHNPWDGGAEAVNQGLERAARATLAEPAAPLIPGVYPLLKEPPVSERNGREKTNPGRSPSPPEPRVQIGTIEILVVAPTPPEPAPRGTASRLDLASRNYLRNF